MRRKFIKEILVVYHLQQQKSGQFIWKVNINQYSFDLTIWKITKIFGLSEKVVPIGNSEWNIYIPYTLL